MKLLITYNAGRKDGALKHYIISAKMGDQDSLTKIKAMFMRKDATRGDYEVRCHGQDEESSKRGSKGG